ncbi:MAG: nucleotidyltransferase domain-containing protein [Candidatus Desantisbacteria bacterium]
MNKQQHLNSFDELQIIFKQSGILKQYSIHRLGVFGSFARNEPSNDIDLLIEDDLPLETALQFKNELETLIKNPLDIMVKRWANPIVLYRAEEEIRYVER